MAQVQAPRAQIAPGHIHQWDAMYGLSETWTDVTSVFLVWTNVHRWKMVQQKFNATAQYCNMQSHLHHISLGSTIRCLQNQLQTAV